MEKIAPYVAKTTLNVAAGNGAKSLTDGAIRISSKLAPIVTLKDVAEGIDLNEVTAAIMLDINKVIAEEDKKITPQTYSKTLSLETSNNENLFHEDILEVISYIPSSSNIWILLLVITYLSGTILASSRPITHQIIRGKGQNTQFLTMYS